MSKYGISESKKVTGTKIKLYKLVINGKCEIDDFESNIAKEGQFNEDLSGIYAVLDKACSLTMLPKGMYRVLKLGNLPYQVFEAKRGVLRYYLIKSEGTGKVIIASGMKADQKQDLENIKKLVKDINKEGIDTNPQKQA